MQRLALPIGNNLLEIHLRFFRTKGDEVRWNGEVVSRKQRFFTSRHHFTVTDDDGQEVPVNVRISSSISGTSYGVRYDGRVVLGSFRDKLTYDSFQPAPYDDYLDLNEKPQKSTTERAAEVLTYDPDDLIV